MPQLSGSLLKARLKGIEVIDLLEAYQLLRGKIAVDYIQDENWFLKTKGFDSANAIFSGRIKRLMDVAISSVFLIMSLPLWPLIALAIKLNSKGPIFYAQERIGKNESVFSLYKFRSMIEKAEEKEPQWSNEDDKRITPVGRILRKLHLDELPQLLNVLKGEMSLVGPRPERPEFVEELESKIPYYSLRHFIKPGMTGWAQVNYPYASSLKASKEKLEYDLYYVSHRNLALDLRILAKTLKIILLLNLA